MQLNTFCHKLKKVINNPWLILAHGCRKWPLRCISDKMFLELYYYTYHHERLNLENPRKFNEKLQWLKLYNRNPEYTKLADKILVREYVEQKIGKKHLVPLLGVWSNPDDICLDSLPEKFVLKCNHDSGSVQICKGKSDFDFNKAINNLKECLKLNQFWKGREYAYLNIEKRVLAEAYLTDSNSDELTDYKLFCFDGEPKFISTDRGRFSKHIRNYYTIDWNFIDASFGEPNDPINLDKKPVLLDEMVKLAKKLSEGIPHVRVDFYISNDNVYFGELTFYHGGGAMTLTPDKYEYIWGDFLKLPPKI